MTELETLKAENKRLKAKASKLLVMSSQERIDFKVNDLRRELSEVRADRNALKDELARKDQSIDLWKSKYQGLKKSLLVLAGKVKGE